MDAYIVEFTLLYVCANHYISDTTFGKESCFDAACFVFSPFTKTIQSAVALGPITQMTISGNMSSWSKSFSLGYVSSKMSTRIYTCTL